jgi:hypothetical protein
MEKMLLKLREMNTFIAKKYRWVLWGTILISTAALFFVRWPLGQVYFLLAYTTFVSMPFEYRTVKKGAEGNYLTTVWLVYYLIILITNAAGTEEILHASKIYIIFVQFNGIFAIPFFGMLWVLGQLSLLRKRAAK